MAKIVWTEPAYQDLDEIAENISLDDPDAADRLVKRLVRHVRQLKKHPESGSIPP
ncbi:MAG: type II toxin-antitoxin system RelE/ParE family toxin, partial [Pyrinomonadaceae bacterium]